MIHASCCLCRRRISSLAKNSVPRASQQFLMSMMDMGFPRAHAELALEETGNVGVEVATEWLCSVPEHVLKQHLEEKSSSGDRRMSSMREELMRALLPRRVPLKVYTGGRDIGWTGSCSKTVAECCRD